MVSFKDKLDRLGPGQKFNSLKNSGNNSVNGAKAPCGTVVDGSGCVPSGNIVDWKSKTSGVTITSGEVTTTDVGQTVCDCINSAATQITDSIQANYPTGPVFTTPKLFTQIATPVEIDQSITAPSPDPTIIGFYDRIPVAITRNNVNATILNVIADPDAGFNPLDPFLYVRYNHGKNETFSDEQPVKVGEEWPFNDVYEVRVRSSFKGQQYRITSVPVHTTYVGVIVNVPPISGQLISQVVIASGNVTVVNASGQTVSVAISGVVVNTSGQLVVTVSGNIVQISGQDVYTNSGSVTSVSGNIVEISGQIIFTASGSIVSVSGQYVAIDDISTVHQFYEVTPALSVASSLTGVELIDVENQLLYVAGNTDPGVITKIDLETFTVLSSITLFSKSGEVSITTGIIDTKNQLAYFGTNLGSGVIIKIDLNTFTEVSTIVGTSGHGFYQSAVLDTVNNKAFFGCGSGVAPSGCIDVIDLTTFSLTAFIVTNSGLTDFRSAVIDPLNSLAYFGSHTEPAAVVDLNTATLVNFNSYLTSGNSFLASAIIDTTSGLIYWGTTSGKVIRTNALFPISVQAVGSVVGTNLACAAIDPTHHIGYFGNGHSGSVVSVISVDLTNLLNINAISFLPGDRFRNDGTDYKISAVIDNVNGFAYFGTGTTTTPGKVVKVATFFDDLSIPAVTVSGDIIQAAEILPTTLYATSSPLAISDLSGGTSLQAGIISPAKAISFRALKTNSGIVYFNGVNNPPFVGFGDILYPGEAKSVPITDLNAVLFCCAISGDQIAYSVIV